ncbi:MAG: formylglycine-generating enzyme family protein [Acidobacteriota bacterium]
MKRACAISIAVIVLFAGVFFMASVSSYQKIVRKPSNSNNASGGKKSGGAKPARRSPSNSNRQPAKEQEQPELETYTETAGGAAIEMIRVPAGRFKMGSPASEAGRDSDEAQHQVSVSSFYMGKYEVTQAEWQAVATKLSKVNRDLEADPSNFKGDNLPVEQVSWEDAVEFCERLSRATGKKYRLPTEAEWEYACRARTTGPYAGNLDSMAWYSGNSGGKTHPVGQKQANGFGLHDMHGNVWEWCMDWYGAYSERSSVDPTGPSTGSNRVRRGGSWHDNALLCRSANRFNFAPSFRNLYLGFRLLRTYR